MNTDKMKFWGSAAAVGIGLGVLGHAVTKPDHKDSHDTVHTAPTASVSAKPHSKGLVVDITDDGKLKVKALLDDGNTVDLNDPRGQEVLMKVLDKAFDEFFEKLTVAPEAGKEPQDTKDANDSDTQKPQEKAAEAPADNSVEKKAELIETNKKLAKEAEGMHTLESWTKAESKDLGILGGGLKLGVDIKIDKEFDKHKDKLASYQLSEPQLKAIKEALSQVVFEHLTKKGNTQEMTAKYVESELAPKMQNLFAELNKIYQANGNHYKSMSDFLVSFDQYSSFHLFEKGEITTKGIHDLLLTDKEALNKLVQGFSEYAANESKIAESK